MVSIYGYNILEQLYNGSRTLVYRAVRQDEKKPVIIKLLKNSFPDFNELVQFRNQYNIAKNLCHPGIIQTYSLDNYQNSYALVMEDMKGVSLHEYIQKNNIVSLKDILSIAIKITDILNYLHQNRVIHKDIKPANILINPETKQVKLIDFSIASLLPKEVQEIKNPNSLEGTLEYLSPEQTGRMNRGIDFRTDFYAFGVTLFELLTGELPFVSDDAMELVHCHIAKQPHSVSSYKFSPQGCGSSANGEEIPQVVSDIVMKLMAKNAENRYQSTLGLKNDLETCLYQLKETGYIKNFAIAKRDICDKFIIPEKLYGRDSEVKELLAAFDRVAGSNNKNTAELILVAGFSGIGKTAVINEVHKPIVQQRGYFIKGKFDQLNRNIPFDAFVQAFQDLIGQLQTESDAQLLNWKSKILQALGDSAQVIIDVIPELEKIIDKQPSAPELSGNAAQNRFNLLFQKFIQVFTDREHPLVIFLDDLQWADSASLKLISLLMSESQTTNLLLIGAYRDNEVFPTHPLILTLSEITKEKVQVNKIKLTPLEEKSLNKLIADTLNCSLSIAKPLTQLVYQKAQGNPFFSTQFLKALYEEGLIKFDRKNNELNRGGWVCDVTKIKAASLTDDVVEFMGLQLQKLPEATQNVLKLAACIGNQFDLGTLAIVSQQSQTDTATALWRAIQEGFIIPQNQVYKFYLGEDKQVNRGRDSQIVNYKFLHDRVQQAAYSLIPEKEKKINHWQIGQSLLNTLSEQQLENKIFEVVNQLNNGLIFDDTKISNREEIARLNQKSGIKAKESIAYSAAIKYFKQGIKLLSVNHWKNQYQLSFELYQ
ncbi:MAG: serine/threonine-protein kinase PknK [Rivularia sp. ALOHA_DT_140]|nr:serine/threonine-protein kinase PknK [Rivularia sp. ALOHA_DT_140]